MLLTVQAFPPNEIAEAAYIVLIPFCLWFYYQPPRKIVIVTALLAGTFSWLFLIIWLRHITLIGTVLLSLALTSVYLLWMLAAHSTLPQLKRKPTHARLLAIAGLAGLWVFFEWLRTWLFSGFPWLPLAASQWQRPALLQVLPWTGAHAISFLLVFFNVAISFYVYRLFNPIKTREWWRRLSPEFYSAFGLLLAAFSVMLGVGMFERNRTNLFAAGVVQPYIPPTIKWDAELGYEVLDTLERLTDFSATLGADIVLWPETATPWPVVGEPRQQEWIERLSAETGVPILMGNMVVDGPYDDPASPWYNTIMLVDPQEGLLTDPFYAKRHLVPFGEYVPLRSLLFFIPQVVDIGNFAPGSEASLLPLNINGRSLSIGPLVCYEDIFPRLARESVLAGADLLFVASNIVWYGEEGMAEQHAAHSVLRAVETRRPVLRVGNGGWSGWIDEFGNIRETVVNEDDSIYFQGADTLSVTQSPAYRSHITFYVENGDWFVLLAVGLMLGGFLLLRFTADAPEAPPETSRQKVKRLLRQGKIRPLYQKR